MITILKFICITDNNIFSKNDVFSRNLRISQNLTKIKPKDSELQGGNTLLYEYSSGNQVDGLPLVAVTEESNS